MDSKFKLEIQYDTATPFVLGASSLYNTIEKVDTQAQNDLTKFPNPNQNSQTFVSDYIRVTVMTVEGQIYADSELGLVEEKQKFTKSLRLGENILVNFRYTHYDGSIYTFTGRATPLVSPFDGSAGYNALNYQLSIELFPYPFFFGGGTTEDGEDGTNTVIIPLEAAGFEIPYDGFVLFPDGVHIFDTNTNAVVIDNQGSSIAYPTWTLVGSGTNFKIENQTTNTVFIAGLIDNPFMIDEGSEVVADSVGQTLTQNGVNRNGLNISGFDALQLVGGKNKITVSVEGGISANTKIIVTYKNTYTIL